MVILDSTFLLFLFDPGVDVPLDSDGQPVTRCKDRIEFLLQSLSNGGIRVMVPTPVLSEVLVSLGEKKSEILQSMQSSYAFKIQPFDERAAIEVAFLTDADLQGGRELTLEETKAKVKYDRQIIAIGKVNNVQTIYSDDRKLCAKARANGIATVQISELPLPPEEPQIEMQLPEPVHE